MGLCLDYIGGQRQIQEVVAGAERSRTVRERGGGKLGYIAPADLLIGRNAA